MSPIKTKYGKYTVSQLKKRADRLWSEVTKLHHGKYCKYNFYKADFKHIGDECKGNLESNHIIGRRCESTRWDIDNCVVLCSKHHKWSNKFSAHGTPTLFGEWLKKVLDPEIFKSLVEKQKVSNRNEHKTSKRFVIEKIEHLKALKNHYLKGVPYDQ